MLTGFISLEEVHLRTSPTSKTPLSWKRDHSMLSSLTQQKWVYGVFQGGTLRCYRRRTDIKLNREPFRVVLLDLDATLVSERQSLILQSRATAKTMRLRVHPSSSTSYLQWVTALYLARLTNAKSSPSTKAPSSDRAKRVTFNEDASEYICSPQSVDSDDVIEATTWRESVDLGDLFYSREDIAAFRQSHRKAQQEETNVGRTVMRSLVSRLRRRPSLDDELEA